jgi:NTP pyrophosphatase (non-canonical NTP hydrolase)
MLGKMQKEVSDWRAYNFPNSTPEEQYMGIVEELGELSHVMLKDRQGIRDIGDTEALAQDAIGDMAIFMINFCDMHGWDFEKILATTWEQVAGRDWRKNPKDGVNG